MIARRLISNRYPYVPIVVTVSGHRTATEAFLDTGFEGTPLIPVGFLPSTIRSYSSTSWIMADGRRVVAPVYQATVQIGDLGSYSVFISALGNEVLIGRRLIDRLSIALDRGRRLIVEL